MATQSGDVWVMKEPNVSREKVLEHMQRQAIDGRALAKRLKIGEAAVSRGLRSRVWLNGKISELAKIFGVQPMALTEQVTAVSGAATLERVCGSPNKSGFPVPPGCHICMLNIDQKWNTYLVGPAGVPVNDGDFAMIETDEKVIVIGQVHEDAASATQWIITRGAGKRPFTVEKDSVLSLRLVISALGGVWGQQ